MLQMGIRLHDVNTACPQAEQTLESRAKKAREEGFSCVHLAPQKIMSGVQWNDCAFTEGLAHHLRRVLAKNDLDIAVLGCYMNLATPDPEQLALFKARYLGSVRVAALSGASVVGTETGAPNREYRFDRFTHTQEALQTFIRNLADVVESAEHYGVTVAIEPVWKHIVCDTQRTVQVLKSIASPNLRVIFDPVNMLCAENADSRDAIFAEAMDRLCDHIAVVHIKDFVRTGGDLKSVAAGTGEMDYRELLRFLKAKKPYIQATLENTDNSTAVRARAHIERIYEEA